MCFGHSFTQVKFWGPKNWFKIAIFLKMIPFSSAKKLICENGDIMHLRVTRSVYRRDVFLYKLTSPTSGLATEYSIFSHFHGSP